MKVKQIRKTIHLETFVDKGHAVCSFCPFSPQVLSLFHLVRWLECLSLRSLLVHLLLTYLLDELQTHLSCKVELYCAISVFFFFFCSSVRYVSTRQITMSHQKISFWFGIYKCYVGVFREVIYANSERHLCKQLFRMNLVPTLASKHDFFVLFPLIQMSTKTKFYLL